MDNLAKKKGLILLVEDEILVGMMLQKKMRSYGYQISDVITSGEEAVEQARVENPALLFMDVALPGRIDGVEAARQIKDFLDIPVIFFTGNHRDKQLIERSKELAPVAILDKLGSFGTVLKAVERALEGA
ncbi:MAG: CheY-like chemotaxis protein [Desulforhopalus sp.]|jgi:CheY-like chemotaxis protein